MIYTDGVHLISSESLEELHDFAIQKLHFKKSWFQWHTMYPRYDLTTTRVKKRALEKGAVLIGGIKLAGILQQVPYLNAFYRESLAEYERDVHIWMKQHQLEGSFNDVQASTQHGVFLVHNKEIFVLGVFKNKYYKDHGFWKSYFNAVAKKKKLEVVQK